MAQVISSGYQASDQQQMEPVVEYITPDAAALQDSLKSGSALQVRIVTEDFEDKDDRVEEVVVLHSASALVAKEEEQPQDQLELLLAELGRIETQQEKLRDAVKHNRGIVVHPRHEVLEESDSDYGTPKAPTPKKKILVSGGLTGFGVAQDLLQIDFSPPEDAPEEFRAVAFFEEPKQIKPGLSGSFGLCDPASKELHHYLERLEEQQKLVLELITGKKQALLEAASKSNTRLTKQTSKLRPQKSRLARNTRLGDMSEKAAVATAFGLAAGDKMVSLGAKMGSLNLASKGALAAKLPMMTLSADSRASQGPARKRDRPANAPNGSGHIRGSTTTHGEFSEPMMQAQASTPMVPRRAQVQDADLDLKEEQDIRSQFAEPLPGSTPSTMHLAGKKSQKKDWSPELPEVEKDTEELAAPKEDGKKGSGQKQARIRLHVRSGGRVSTLGTVQGANDDTAETLSRGEAKFGLRKGLKMMLKGRTRTST